jgi:hypothetical protein
MDTVYVEPRWEITARRNGGDSRRQLSGSSRCGWSWEPEEMLAELQCRAGWRDARLADVASSWIWGRLWMVILTVVAIRGKSIWEELA